MKHKLTIIICLTVLAVFAGVIMYNAGKSEKVKYDDNKEKLIVSSDVKPISEVSKSVKNDFLNAREKTEHLKFNDIEPYCPDVPTVYGFHYFNSANYKNINNEKEMLDEQIGLMERVLERNRDELILENCIVDFYWAFDQKEDYESFKEFLSDDEGNKKRTPSNLGYIDQNEEHILEFYVPPNFNSVSFNKGKCYEQNHENRMKHEDGITTLTQPRFVCDEVEEYYVFEDSERLDDKWKLTDGELSVREGIQIVEEYLNNTLRMEDENPEIKLKVAYVQVYKINNDTYCYRYKIRRCIGGVMCVSVSNGASVGSADLDYDMADAYQIEKNAIDMYDGPTKVLVYDKENESEEILPLGKAIDILEKSLGGNSKYTVSYVELGYLVRFDNADTQEDGHAEVCWVFSCINEQDKWITEFYVNALTGEIKTYARHQ